MEAMLSSSVSNFDSLTESSSFEPSTKTASREEKEGERVSSKEFDSSRGTASREEEEERVSSKEERRLSLKIGSSQVLKAISNVSS